MKATISNPIPMNSTAIDVEICPVSWNAKMAAEINDIKEPLASQKVKSLLTPINPKTIVHAPIIISNPANNIRTSVTTWLEYSHTEIPKYRKNIAAATFP